MLSSTSTMTNVIISLLAIFSLASASLADPVSKRGTGTLTISSICKYDVWYQIVSQIPNPPPTPYPTPSPWAKVPSGGVKFPWSKFPPFSRINDDGVSIKLGLKDFTNLTPDKITQVEIAWDQKHGKIVYDASDLNAYGPSPFYEQGYVMWADEAASDAFPLCNTVYCAPGENPCTHVYWYGEPVNSTTGESIINHIHTCRDSANIVFQVCTG